MPFSPPPDYLYQSIHPVTGVTTTYTKMIESDLSFGRASASYAVFSGDGGINPFASGAAPLKIRTFKFTYIHPYLTGETFTQQRDALMQAVMHGREMDFFVRVGDGSLRKGHGVGNVSDMRETRDAMVLFQATIEFECVNPYLTDQYDTGTLRWDSGLFWDVGHQVYSLAASATLTAGTFRLVQGANQTAAQNYYARAEDINFALANATPAPINAIAVGGVPGQPSGTGAFNATTPYPVTISAVSPGVITPITLTQTGITGGTLALTSIQAGSAVTPQLWDADPNYFPLTAVVTNHVITAAGNVDDRECIITVYGPIDQPYYVYDLSIGGGLFGYLGFIMQESLGAGEIHVIDIGRQSVVKQVGANTYSSWQYFYWPPGQADWFRIAPGPNVISIQQGGTLHTGGTTAVSVRTKGHYL